MSKDTDLYSGFRYPGEIISHAVWLYHRFALSFRNVEEILWSRGVEVTYESVRQWRLRFGAEYAKRIRVSAGRCGDTWYCALNLRESGFTLEFVGLLCLGGAQLDRAPAWPRSKIA